MTMAMAEIMTDAIALAMFSRVGLVSSLTLFLDVCLSQCQAAGMELSIEMLGKNAMMEIGTTETAVITSAILNLVGNALTLASTS